MRIFFYSLVGSIYVIFLAGRTRDLIFTILEGSGMFSETMDTFIAGESTTIV